MHELGGRAHIPGMTTFEKDSRPSWPALGAVRVQTEERVFEFDGPARTLEVDGSWTLRGEPRLPVIGEAWSPLVSDQDGKLRTLHLGRVVAADIVAA